MITLELFGGKMNFFLYNDTALAIWKVFYNNKIYNINIIE